MSEQKTSYAELKEWTATLERQLGLNHSNADEMNERWLIVPVLRIIRDRPGIETGLIIDQACREIELDKHALVPMPSRSDARVTQMIRNLKSHNTLSRNGLADYQSRRWYISDKGRELLSSLGL